MWLVSCSAQVTYSAAVHRAQRRDADAGLSVAEELNFDEDAVAYQITQDNFGRVRQMEYKRIELTTTWIRNLRLSAAEARRRRDLDTKWVDMCFTGINDGGALHPMDVDYAILGVTVLEYIRAVDALPDLEPDVVETLALPNLNRERRVRVNVRDVTAGRDAALYKQLGIDESGLRCRSSSGGESVAAEEEKTAPDVDRGAFGFRPAPNSVWIRECISVWKEKLLNFAETAAVLQSIVLFFECAEETDGVVDDSSGLRRSVKDLFFVGDGAPVMAMQKAQKVIFRQLLERAQAGEDPFPSGDNETMSLAAGFESEDDEDQGEEVPPEERIADEAPRPAMRNNLSVVDTKECAALMSTTLIMGSGICFCRRCGTS